MAEVWGSYFRNDACFPELKGLWFYVVLAKGSGLCGFPLTIIIPATNDRFQSVDDLLEGHAVATNLDRVFGGHQGAYRPLGITLVTLILCGQHVFKGGVLALRF